VASHLSVNTDKKRLGESRGDYEEEMMSMKIKWVVAGDKINKGELDEEEDF